MGMVIREVCPRCKSAIYKKNGHIHKGGAQVAIGLYCHHHLNVQPISCDNHVMIQCLEVEADEMANFVQKKANKQWIWLAMDARTRQIIAFHVRDRSRQSARKLWAKIPKAYRQQATFYTDQYVVYEGVMPAAQHRAINKKARKTNHIERFNNTFPS